MENLARPFSGKQQNIPEFLELGEVEEVAFEKKERRNRLKTFLLNKLTLNDGFSLFSYFLVDFYI